MVDHLVHRRSLGRNELCDDDREAIGVTELVSLMTLYKIALGGKIKRDSNINEKITLIFWGQQLTQA